MERRQTFSFQKPRELEAIGQTKAARHCMRGTDRAFGQHDGFHDSASQQRHVGTQAANDGK
jgi:hypothetical protein